MGAAEIDAYLTAAGEEVLESVGAYQVEALGARLFERIDGDYFAVLGLSLMPVLGYLRHEGLLAY
jgi:septum formation protein